MLQHTLIRESNKGFGNTFIWWLTLDSGLWSLAWVGWRSILCQKQTTAWEDTLREGRRLGWQKPGGESLISYQATGSFFHKEHSCYVRWRRKCLPDCIHTWSLFLIFLRIVASESLVLDHRQEKAAPTFQIIHGNTDILSLPNTAQVSRRSKVIPYTEVKALLSESAWIS